MLEKLTPEQEAQLAVIKNKWLNKVFNYELYHSNTFESIKDKMIELYEFCGLEKPIVILVDSPLGCQIAANIFKNPSQVESQVWSQVESQVRSQVFNFSRYISYSDFGWLSWADFYNLHTEILDSFSSKINQIINFSESSFMSIQLDRLCIVSKFPSKIHRNSFNDLHNINEAAISFADGYQQHYFNGIFVEESLFKNLINKEYSFDDWTKEENEEIKSLVLAFYEEKFGGEFVYRFLSQNLKEVDTYVDKKESIYLENTTKGMNIGVYTLFKGNINNIDIAYIRCYCPSTDRMFFLGVDPSNNNAKDAIASLCQIPTQLKNNLVSISRQGECFSFNFDEKGTELLQENKINFNEVVSLKGDEYFSKIKFEY